MAETPPSAPAPFTWPTEADGTPMAVVMVSAAELVGSGQGMPDYSNITLGPVSFMLPCKNDAAVIEETAREGQRLCQYLIGTERRAVQWAMDPSLKPLHPGEIPDERAEEKAKES